MKSPTIFLALILFVSFIFQTRMFAQAPAKMSYQAVVRDQKNQLVLNKPVGMRISILQGSAEGEAVFVETHNPTSNANGLISIQIGEFENIGAIGWAEGPYFLKAEIDPAGGTAYTIIGTSQLLSVPYAFHAKTAETFTGAINETDPFYAGSPAVDITTSDITKLGNLSGTNTGDQDLSSLATSSSLTTGLAAKVDKVTGKGLSTEDYTTAEKTKLTEISNGAEVNVNADWNAIGGDAQILNKPTIPAAADGSETKLTAGINVTITGNGTTSSPYVVNATDGGSGSFYLGQEHQGGIIFYLYIGSDGLQHGLLVSKTEYKATWSGSRLTKANKTSNGAYNMDLMPTGVETARTWVETLGAGWYLPSIDELSILWHNRFHVNNSTASGLTLLSTLALYWSSTEYDATDAFVFRFGFGSTNIDLKLITYSVRAVRAF